MFAIKNFTDGTNSNVKVIDQKGAFSIAEYQCDLSVTPMSAETSFFCSEMDVRRRQLVCELDGTTSVIMQAGAMQWMVGDVHAETGIKGAGDLVGKMFRGAASGESAIKPVYTGRGTVVCEPTYKHIVLVDLAHEWDGGIVLEDGFFLACDASLKQSLARRTNISSAVAGNEGLFNLQLTGAGVVAVELPCPAAELICVSLNNDVLKVDGNFAVMWSPTLEFTVERAGKTLVGSAASGEGLVNVYRGSGRVVMMPVA